LGFFLFEEVECFGPLSKPNYMGGLDHCAGPFLVMLVVSQIPPTLMEILRYYIGGGLVEFEHKQDETFNKFWSSHNDWWIYYKRFLDRPKSDGAKAYFAWLDWSASTWDKSIYIHRRQLAKRDREVNRLRPYVYGPYIFNWKAAHDKQWLRGDDAAGYGFPCWGIGGEERARKEFEEAKAKGYKYYWHHQVKHKLDRRRAKKGADRVGTQTAVGSGATG
jgi:hypothetical protein